MNLLKRYSMPEMEELWSEESKYRLWLEIELAVCKAWAKLGRIPSGAVEEIKKNVKLDIERIKEVEKTTRHD
ncbi:MAG TPA: adenylosuccinate lyase, partial [Halanaerobiales bacterium]|nr:adenylosuccinate lyase [Halanaerobiales bacterium]